MPFYRRYRRTHTVSAPVPDSSNSDSSDSDSSSVSSIEETEPNPITFLIDKPKKKLTKSQQRKKTEALLNPPTFNYLDSIDEIFIKLSNYFKHGFPDASTYTSFSYSRARSNVSYYERNRSFLLKFARFFVKSAVGEVYSNLHKQWIFEGLEDLYDKQCGSYHPSTWYNCGYTFSFTGFLRDRIDKTTRYTVEETNGRTAIVKEEREAFRLLKKETADEMKILVKLCRPVPDGYFMSRKLLRVLRDTPENRYRETLPVVEVKKKSVVLAELLAGIEGMTDLAQKTVEVRMLGCVDAAAWDRLNVMEKTELLKKRQAKKARLSQAYGDSQVKKNTQGNVDGVSKLKIRTTKKYVLSPEAEAALAPMETINQPDEEEFDETPSSKKSTPVTSRVRTPVANPDFDWTKFLTSTTGKISRTVKLRDYQLRTVEWLREHRGAIAAFQTGMGKTLTAVASALCLLESGTVSKIYVVAPKSLTHNFNKELTKFLGVSAAKKYASDTKETTDTKGEKTTDPKLIEHFTHAKFCRAFAEDPTLLDNCGIIIDEIQEFRTPINERNATGKNAFTMINCCIRAKRVLGLTATPLYNDFGDAVNQVAMIRGMVPMAIPGTLAGKVELFKDVFAFQDADPETTKDLPRKELINIDFTMSLEYYAQYLAVQRNTDESVKDSFAFLTGLRHAASKFANNPKIDWCVERVVTLGRKTLIFAPFIEDEVDVLSKRFTEAGVKHVKLVGKMSERQRVAAIQEFNSLEEGTAIVFIISKAGNLGIDLVGVQDVISISEDWTDSSKQQTIGRAVRIGSHAHLEPSERVVRIFCLRLIKPARQFLAEGDNVPSACSLIRGIVEKKTEMLAENILFLKTLDIDPAKAAAARVIFEEKYLGEANVKITPLIAEVKETLPTVDANAVYEILGVLPGSSVEDCETAFARVSAETHPDQHYTETHANRLAQFERFERAKLAMDIIRGLKK